MVAAKPPIPSYAHKACSFLLSSQLLRPDGITGLCAALFGEGIDASDSDVSLDKLENFATAVQTIPHSVQSQVRPEYDAFYRV